MKKANALYEKALEFAAEDIPDYERASKLLEEAADYGSGDALYAIGNWYFHGRHYPQNVSLAIDYWKKSALKSNLDAIHELAKIYECGVYLEKDLARSFYYYCLLYTSPSPRD